MNYQYYPFVWLLGASAIITLSLGIYAVFRRRNAIKPAFQKILGLPASSVSRKNT